MKWGWRGTCFSFLCFWEVNSLFLFRRQIQCLTLSQRPTWHLQQPAGRGTPVMHWIAGWEWQSWAFLCVPGGWDNTWSCLGRTHRREPSVKALGFVLGFPNRITASHTVWLLAHLPSIVSARDHSFSVKQHASCGLQCSHFGVLVGVCSESRSTEARGRWTPPAAKQYESKALCFGCLFDVKLYLQEF